MKFLKLSASLHAMATAAVSSCPLRRREKQKQLYKRTTIVIHIIDIFLDFVIFRFSTPKVAFTRGNLLLLFITISTIFFTRNLMTVLDFRFG